MSTVRVAGHTFRCTSTGVDAVADTAAGPADVMLKALLRLLLLLLLLLLGHAPAHMPSDVAANRNIEQTR